MGKVYNEYGVCFDFDTVVGYMDSEICEELHSVLAPCDEQLFFDSYCGRHFDVYGVEFEFAKSNPVW